MDAKSTVIPMLPCNDLDAAEAFYNRLGFSRPLEETPPEGLEDGFRMLADAQGGQLYLTQAMEGWLVPGQNPFGLYLRMENVDALAREFQGELLGGQTGPVEKAYGMYEFALNGPDETYVMVGWPTRLRGPGGS